MSSEQSNHDQWAWKQVTKTIKPLKDRELNTIPESYTKCREHQQNPGGKNREPANEESLKDATATNPIRPRYPLKPRLKAQNVLRTTLEGIDRRQALRIRKGRISFDRKLDLHGMRVEQAGREIIGVLRAMYSRGERNALIVTGKGQGLIRQELLRQLHGAELGSTILAYTQARPGDGGSGAYYVQLRKRK